MARWTRSGGAHFVILIALVVTVGLAGGASRADTWGQGVVRAASLLAIAGWVLTGSRFDMGSVRAPLLVVVGALFLVAAQLVPLPPSVWSSLPGRGYFAAMDRVLGLEGTWRPLALVPDGALNALLSLLIPLAVLLGMSASSARSARGSVLSLLTIVGASALIGLLQLSGGAVGNPFINDNLGQPAGLFANRNHQALFLDLGVLLAIGWGFDPSRRLDWRSWSALCFAALLALLVVATGSRAGLGLLGLSFLLSAAIAWPAIGMATRKGPRWVRPTGFALAIIIAAGLLVLSIGADRSTALDRLVAADTAGDMRTRALPTLRMLVERFLPFGSGVGSFDPVFRLAEPFDLLKLSYFNHAHNDYVEVLLEAGLPGTLLTLSALVWWMGASWRAWRRDPRYGSQARMGSSVILLIALASAVDYPARTPLIMLTLAVAAAWLARPVDRGPGQAPRTLYAGGGSIYTGNSHQPAS